MADLIFRDLSVLEDPYLLSLVNSMKPEEAQFASYRAYQVEDPKGTVKAFVVQYKDRVYRENIYWAGVRMSDNGSFDTSTYSLAKSRHGLVSALNI